MSWLEKVTANRRSVFPLDHHLRLRLQIDECNDVGLRKQRVGALGPAAVTDRTRAISLCGLERRNEDVLSMDLTQ